MDPQSILSPNPQAKRGPDRKPQPRITVFDYLLCRILACGAAGFDVTPDIENARTLAQLMEWGDGDGNPISPIAHQSGF